MAATAAVVGGVIGLIGGMGSKQSASAANRANAAENQKDRALQLQLGQMQQDTSLKTAGMQGVGSAAGLANVTGGAEYARLVNRPILAFNQGERARYQQNAARLSVLNKQAFTEFRDMAFGNKRHTSPIDQDIEKNLVTAMNRGSAASGSANSGKYLKDTTEALSSLRYTTQRQRQSDLFNLMMAREGGPNQLNIMSGAMTERGQARAESIQDQLLELAKKMASGQNPGGTCKPGFYFDRREAGDMDPSGTRELAAGEEYCLPNGYKPPGGGGGGGEGTCQDVYATNYGKPGPCVFEN